MLSLEVSPQRLHVTHTKEKVVVAAEEPRGHSSTKSSKWMSPPTRHIGLSLQREAPRETQLHGQGLLAQNAQLRSEREETSH